MGKKYKTPPIIEALCEFEFLGTETPAFLIPGLMYNQLKETYPTQGKSNKFSLHTQFGQSNANLTLAERIQFFSEDGKQILQIAQNQLIINHLEPYPSWEKFLPFIESVYKSYIEVANPTGIRYIALRYINKLYLQKTLKEANEFFNYRPFWGLEFPAHIKTYLVVTENSFENDRDSLKTQFGTLSPDEPSTNVFLLDLEYKLIQENAVELNSIKEWLEIGHKHLENTFEACLTSTLKQQFE